MKFVTENSKNIENTLQTTIWYEKKLEYCYYIT